MHYLGKEGGPRQGGGTRAAVGSAPGGRTEPARLDTGFPHCNSAGHRLAPQATPTIR